MWERDEFKANQHPQVSPSDAGKWKSFQKFLEILCIFEVCGQGEISKAELKKTIMVKGIFIWTGDIKWPYAQPAKCSKAP